MYTVFNTETIFRVPNFFYFFQIRRVEHFKNRFWIVPVDGYIRLILGVCVFFCWKIIMHLSGRTRLSFYWFSHCNKTDVSRGRKKRRIIAFAALKITTTTAEKKNSFDMMNHVAGKIWFMCSVWFVEII